MKIVTAMLIGSFSFLNDPALVQSKQAGFRSQVTHGDLDPAPDWLARIAENAKHRSIAPAASADALIEGSTHAVDAAVGSGDGVEPPTSANEAEGPASPDKHLRSSRGSEWVRTRFPLLASKDSQLEAAATELDPDPLNDGDTKSAVGPALTDELFGSLVHISSAAPFDEKKVVWVTAYPRSGSTSILAMISPPERKEWKTFTAFEPCVGRGSPWKKLMQEGCRSEVRRVTRCDYQGVDHIGAKEKFDNFVLYDADLVNAPSLSSAQTAEACSASDVVAFKTITYEHDLMQVVPVLEEDARIRVLDVVRDPRGIYASWLTTDPFRGLVTGEHKPYWRRHDRGWFSSLTGICDQFQKNLHNPHPRIRRILFENLIKDPESVAKKNYEWLGLPFDDAAKSWLHANFNGNCPKENAFSTCRGNSSASLLKWKEILPLKEQEAFTAHPACREIAMFYGYPLE